MRPRRQANLTITSQVKITGQNCQACCLTATSRRACLSGDNVRRQSFSNPNAATSITAPTAASVMPLPAERERLDSEISARSKTGEPHFFECTGVTGRPYVAKASFMVRQRCAAWAQSTERNNLITVNPSHNRQKTNRARNTAVHAPAGGQQSRQSSTRHTASAPTVGDPLREINNVHRWVMLDVLLQIFRLQISTQPAPNQNRSRVKQQPGRKTDRFHMPRKASKQAFVHPSPPWK